MKEDDIQNYTDREAIITACKKKALRLLEISDKTEKQLRDRLKEGDFPPFAVDEAVSYAESFHYLDDRRYTEVYIRSKAGRKSRNAIRLELKRNGVAEEIIDEFLDSDRSPLDETAAVRDQFIKKYAAKASDDPGIYEKAFRYFAQKGYGFEAIRNGIRSALDQEDT